MPDHDLDYAPAHELAALVRSGELSPVALMERSLARIEALNPTLNAFVEVDAEGAMRQAEALAERLAGGEAAGPFAGLPLGVKDLENAAGFVTTKGSRLYRDNRVDFDDAHVARLKAAGAIIVGKTNTPEFGHIPFTDNELFGSTLNPWNLERTPGGSSGGSSAALASGMVPLATASDGGGSIRIPACYTGLYGLKPSQGRTPIAPRPMPTWLSISCYGPLTRSVRDAAIYLDVVVGPDPRDPESLPAPDVSYAETLEEPLPKLRIAFNETLGVTTVQRDVLREVREAAEAFADMGHDIVETDDTIPEMGGWWARVSAFQSLGQEWDNFSTRHDEFTRRYIRQLDRALEVGPSDFQEFLRRRGELVSWTAGLFGEYDLLLTPTLPTEAFAPAGPIPREIEGERANAIAYTYPFNFTGHPAASVPAGLTDAGLPCGLQIVGPRHRDDLVLRASYAYEQARPFPALPREPFASV
ncbi:MAG: amidase [Chloroflexota bacterium]|nr:amidase [Chloroflexota bacterium]